MRQAIPQQHPAVVLRSTYKQLRALLAVAMVALVGLSTTVVILANEDNGSTKTASSTASTASVRPDGGPEESSVAAAIGNAPAPSYGVDESKLASEIDTGSQQTQPKVFHGERFGGHRTH